MKRKIFAFLFGTVLFYAPLAGCGQDVNVNSPSASDIISESTASAEENSEPSDIKNAEINLTFEGRQITLPCLSSELDFIQIDESSLCSSYGYCTGYIMDGRQIIGNIFFDAAEDDKDVSERTVIGIEFSAIGCSKIANNELSVYCNGITINDTKEKVEELLGEPYKEKTNDYYLSYLIDENDTEKYYSFGYDGKENKIESISYYVK